MKYNPELNQINIKINEGGNYQITVSLISK